MIENLKDIDRKHIYAKREKVLGFQATGLRTLLIFVVAIPLASFLIHNLLIDGKPMIAVVILSLSIGGILWIGRCCLHLAQLSIYANSYYRGVNDNNKSIEFTYDVVKRAKQWVVFHDYGENHLGNIYNNHKISNLLLAKLKKSKSFQVSIIFADTGDAVRETVVVKELLKWKEKNIGASDQVSIAVETDNLSDTHEEHYKINDTGYAFITQHEKGENNRKFSFFAPEAVGPIKQIDECLHFHNRIIKDKEARYL